ncbi:MAG: CoA transferase [Nitrospinota bacterium]|nr:CoA transferase [Nitrospinota bacterium]
MGSLDGIKVLDLTHYVAGPFCTLLLADAGADVIKLEPLGGDIIREFPSTFDGESRLFLGLNRNKRSIAINLKEDVGKELVLKMCEEIDVFVEGYRPGVVENLGLGPKELIKRNSRLVYLSISAFGQSGPLKSRRGIDPIVQTYSGIPAEQGSSEDPQLVQGHFIDYFTGSLSSTAVSMALFSRERSGLGQYIDSSLLGGAASLQQGRLTWASDREKLENVRDPLTDRIARIYNTLDGHIYLYMDVDRFWKRACGVLGLSELTENSKWKIFRDRHDSRGEIIPLVQNALLKKTADDWVKRFDKAEVPCAKVRLPARLLEDEQMEAMSYLSEIVHEKYGKLKMIAPSVRFSETPSTVRLPPPILGEHTDEILSEFGLGDDEILRLREFGVLLPHS